MHAPALPIAGEQDGPEGHVDAFANADIRPMHGAQPVCLSALLAAIACLMDTAGTAGSAIV